MVLDVVSVGEAGGSSGRYKAPFWPQALKALPAPNTPTTNQRRYCAQQIFMNKFPPTNERPIIAESKEPRVNESEFNRRVDETLLAIEQALENNEADLDWDLTGGILDIEFPNRSHIVINLQTPTRQIWVATKGGGFHFDFDAEQECWRLGDDELMQFLTGACTRQAGEPITIR